MSWLDKFKNGKYWRNPETGIEFESPLQLIASEFFGFCGCGDPEGAVLFVRDQLVYFKNRDTNKRPKDSHERWFILYELDKLGLIEHGFAISSSWLTDLGNEILEAINEAEKWREA